MPRRSSLRKRLLFAAVPLLVSYLVLETIVSVVAWALWWNQSFWLFEDSGRTWRFDAVRGYRLSTTPSRFLRVTEGTLEYVGTARGNAQGFADRDDFALKRSRPTEHRYAVFGDSFTEAQFLGQNWPDRAEDLRRNDGEDHPVQLLNFAISGGGLANWWSVLTKHVEPEGYELDGVIFAVFAGDLERTFTVWDHSAGVHPLFGRSPSWAPESFPQTLADAHRFLHEHPATILSPEAFERTLQGHWPPSVPRRFGPYLLTKLWRLARPSAAEVAEVPARGDDPDRDRLIADIARCLADHHWPALVIHIPDRPSLLNPSSVPSWPLDEAQAFAHALGAQFLDGRQAFTGLKPAEIRAQFLPYDGHWNQAGSNRFAAFVVRNLALLERSER
jgi:hypothetical protein